MSSIDQGQAVRHSRARQRPHGSHSPLRAFVADERGATAIEYGLMVACLALFIITAVTAVGTNLGGVFNKVSNVLH